MRDDVKQTVIQRPKVQPIKKEVEVAKNLTPRGRMVEGLSKLVKEGRMSEEEATDMLAQWDALPKPDCMKEETK